MDERQFDALAKTLGQTANRLGFVRLASGLVLASMASLRGLGGVTARQVRAEKGQARKSKSCAADHNDAICHCPPGQGGTHCKIQCDTGGGHDLHPFDCRCYDGDPNNPRPLPFCDVCPGDPEKGDPCAPFPPSPPGPPPTPTPTSCGGSCQITLQCPAIVGCACDRAAGTCGVPVTCGGYCAGDGDCAGFADCVCHKLPNVTLGLCGPPRICAGTCHSDTDCSAEEGCVCKKVHRKGKTSKRGLCVFSLSPPAPPPPAPPICSGNCTTSAECPVTSDCVCNVFHGSATGSCGLPRTCEGACLSDAQCLAQADCVCSKLQGHVTGTCGAPQICGGSCDSIRDCPAVDNCVCNKPGGRRRHGKGTCGAPPTPPSPPTPTPTTCTGSCNDAFPCPAVESCACNRQQGKEFGTCGAPQTCGGHCGNTGDCLALANCTCHKSGKNRRGTCSQGSTPPAPPPGPPSPPAPAPPPITPPPPGTCSGLVCSDNTGCLAAGGDACVCFTGSNTAEITAAATGVCSECLGTGVACLASTECCGQLSCLDSGICGLKAKAPRDCHKHGQSCHRDNDCCAQGICYRGKCGEKDTHCNNDGECAQGYHCQGGPLTPGHRRCRRSGHRRHNRKH